jgi:hypothetical protein
MYDSLSKRAASMRPRKNESCINKYCPAVTNVYLYSIYFLAEKIKLVFVSP